MNENSPTDVRQNKMPSDGQTDSLLRDFFRLEVPIELNQPLQLSPVSATTLTVVAERAAGKPRSRSVRILAVAISVAAMAMAVLVVVSGNNSHSSGDSNIADGLINVPAKTPIIDNPMLVSPGSDSKNTTKPVGADGVTLEETDVIEVHPQN